MTKLTDIIDTLDNAADSFESIATKEQKKLFDEVLTLAKDLETDTLGKVKQTIGNLKRLTQIKAKLAALAKDKDWAAGIAKFAQYFGTLQKMQNEYYSQHFPEATFSETAKKKNELMKQLAVQNTIEALMGDGLKANVTDKLNDILLRAVTTGAKYSDLQEELRAHLMGKDGGQGALVRYTTAYATTALSQYTGQHNKLLTDDLDTEWFMYTGSNKETTREFCEHLTAKKYIHRSEIPTILTGKIDDYQCAIYPKTGLPYGMIEGTTPENFQCNCGGWNCRHQLVPVADAVVPAHLRARFAHTTPEPAPKPAKPQPIDTKPTTPAEPAPEQRTMAAPKKKDQEVWAQENKQWLQDAQQQAEKTGVSLEALFDKNAARKDLEELQMSLSMKMRERETKWNDALTEIDKHIQFFINEGEQGINSIIYRKLKQLNVMNGWNSVQDNDTRIKQVEGMKQLLADCIEMREMSKEKLHKTVVKGLEQKGVDYIEAKKRDVVLSEKEIIKQIAGEDETGYCSTLALTYAGNKLGFDVTDFRGGDSGEYFSRDLHIGGIISACGGQVVPSKNHLTDAKNILARVRKGHEYYFGCGEHAAIVRLNKDGKLEFLDLQGGYKRNVWYVLNPARLKRRFNAKDGLEHDKDIFFIDIEKFGKQKSFRELLGYINTKANN